MQKPQKARGRPYGRMDGRTYYTVTQGILTRGLWPHVLCAITVRAFIIVKKRSGRPYRERDKHTGRQT